jgi:hypothetical protein
MALAILIPAGPIWTRSMPKGARRVDFAGYSDCILLANADTRVVLDPNCGGRVLEYSWKGVNSIMLDPDQDGWIYGPNRKRIDPCGGRLDIGPEMTIPKHPTLWLGAWTGATVGQRKARLTSQHDEATGVQLVRDFELSAESSHLRVTQTIRNVSHETVSYCHWSRTLACPNGICVVPLTPLSRFPKGYVMYGPGPVMNYRPQDPSIRIQDGHLVIDGLPKYPKLGIDTYAGWLAYLMREDLLFVKRFPSYPDRIYGEMAAITVSIYYHPKMCELEPIGPMERLEPDSAASYTEDWWLLEMRYPEGVLDLDGLCDLVHTQAR